MAETEPVRPGEEIDVERLGAFLSKELDLDEGEIEVEQFPAGSSNLISAGPSIPNPQP